MALMPEAQKRRWFYRKWRMILVHDRGSQWSYAHEELPVLRNIYTVLSFLVFIYLFYYFSLALSCVKWSRSSAVFVFYSWSRQRWCNDEFIRVNDRCTLQIYLPEHSAAGSQTNNTNNNAIILFPKRKFVLYSLHSCLLGYIHQRYSIIVHPILKRN